jgi:hypothetical protein
MCVVLVDNWTVEILRTCGAGGWIRLVRRLNVGGELVQEVSGRRPDGYQVQARFVLEKQ